MPFVLKINVKVWRRVVQLSTLRVFQATHEHSQHRTIPCDCKTFGDGWHRTFTRLDGESGELTVPPRRKFRVRCTSTLNGSQVYLYDQNSGGFLEATPCRKGGPQTTYRLQ